MNGGAKVANSSVIFSWLAWFLSHIEQINSVVQFFVLLLAAVASICAIRYHTKKPQ
jgi:hypothetical protein